MHQGRSTHQLSCLVFFPCPGSATLHICHELSVMLVANAFAESVCFGGIIMSCIAGMAVCKAFATAAGQPVCCEIAGCAPLSTQIYLTQAFLPSMHERHILSFGYCLSSWLHIASRLQGASQQECLWQPLLLFLLLLKNKQNQS